GPTDSPTLTVKCKFTPKKSDGSTRDGSWERLTPSESDCQKLCDDAIAMCAPSASFCSGIAGGICCDIEKTTCEKTSAFAAPPAPHQFTSITPTIEIPLPTLGGFTDITIQGDAPNRYLLIPWLGQYIAAIYKYAIGIVGILSGIMIVIGGLLWLTAGGAADRVSTAKSYIESSLVGLVIALTSYLLLYAINPKLTEFDSLRVNYIERALAEDWAPLTQEEVQENTTSPDSTPTSTGPVETGENNVPYFAQFRGEWAEKCCGSDPESDSCPGYTLKASGCRLTSYAMVLKYYFPDKNIDPGVVSLLGGARCNVNATQLSSGLWGQIEIESVNINKAKELLDQKKPIVILCRPCVGLTDGGSSAHKYKGHYMVLTGYHGDTFNVNDPGSNPNKRISSMTIEMMRNPCNFVSSDDESRIKERCQNPVSNPSLYYLHPMDR
ncbi:MAG: C39 family peptidase, partial [Patescibacteria group bacterium]